MAGLVTEAGVGTGFLVLSDSFISGSCSGLLWAAARPAWGQVSTASVFLWEASASRGRSAWGLPCVTHVAVLHARSPAPVRAHACYCRSFLSLNRHFGKGHVLRVHV